MMPVVRARMQLPACYVLSSGLILLLLLTMTMLPTVYCYCCYAVQDKATVTVSAAAPLSLRIPCWCNSATVTVGSQQPKTAPACAHFQLDSAPANTPIVIAFNNSIRIYTWHANGNDCFSSFSLVLAREVTAKWCALWYTY